MPDTLRLTLSAGAFVIRTDEPGWVQTCYTDSTGMSRSARASWDDMAAFARAFLAIPCPRVICGAQ